MCEVITQEKCTNYHLCYGVLGDFSKLRISTVSLRHVSPSVHPSSWNNLAPTKRIYIKFFT